MRVCFPRLAQQAEAVAAAAGTMAHVEGSVSQVIYRSPKTAYAVLEVRVEPIAAQASKRVRHRKVTVVGHCPLLEQGCFVRAAGQWVESPKHGLQLLASTVSQVTPTSADACKRYLRLFTGVGPKRAADLVEAFPGENVFDILDTNPQRLLGAVRGVGPAAVKRLSEEWRAKKGHHEAAAFLHSVGVGPAIAERLSGSIGSTPEQCARAVKENPYAVVGLSGGLLSFPHADEIALKHLRMSPDDERRVREGLVHVVSRLAWAGGHTCVETEAAVREATKLLGLKSSDPVRAALLREQAGGRLPCFDGGATVSPLRLAECEASIAASLRRIMNGPHPLPFINPEECVRMAEKEFGSAGGQQRLGQMQAEAVRQAMKCKVLIVTGGPGVGKTTAISSIVGSFRRLRIETVVASPTGRASAKLAQVTRQKATTLHRLLEFDPALGSFKRNASNKLVGSLFLVDEASMIDAELAAAFLAAVPDRAVLVLVGDVDQLPAVGPGAVLQDLVSHGGISVVRLDRNFRQAEHTSHIVRAAHGMLGGALPAVMPYDIGSGLESFADFVGESDLRLFPADTPGKVMSGVVHVMDDLKRRFGVDPVEDVQVLTALRKGPLGSRAFNTALQHHFNTQGDAQPLRLQDASGVYAFRVGDKVMQIVNDYYRDVYNGEIGRVVGMGEGGAQLQVRFPNHNSSGGDEAGPSSRIIEYRTEELKDVEPAFACTIHKSQGCEFPVAIVPAHSLYAGVMQRNLLYTGITRGAKLTVIVGDMRAVNDAIGRTGAGLRKTRLQRLIQEKQ